jgi:hypothetical protein
MDHTNGYLPKMLPGFEQQPNIENPDAPAEVEENGLAAEPVDPAAEKDQAPPEMLNQIVSFLRNYLVCTGTLVRDFGIFIRNLHYAPSFKGYLFQSFKDAWERFLPPLTVCSGKGSAFETNAATINS